MEDIALTEGMDAFLVGFCFFCVLVLWALTFRGRGQAEELTEEESRSGCAPVAQAMIVVAILINIFAMLVVYYVTNIAANRWDWW